MADAVKRNTVMKAKIAVKDLGNPKKAAALEDGDTSRITLGRVIGIATDIKKGLNPTGEPYMGLVGSFEGIPQDEAKDIIQSGVCYLPAGITEAIAGQLVASGKPVSFGFDIKVFKAQNAAGLSYELVPLIAPSENDPLKAVRDAVSKALPAPETKPEAGKGKSKE